MPGLHAMLRATPGAASTFEAALADQRTDSALTVETLHAEDGALVAFSGHEGYPRRVVRYDKFLIVVEGAVYNREESDVEHALRGIAGLFDDRAALEPAIKMFMESSDGDFIVMILDRQSPRMLVFNDRWGRLPTYYHQGVEVVAISRTVAFLLHQLPAIRLDRQSMAEFLMMGYVLGFKTLIGGISKLEPATMILARVGGEALECEVATLIAIRFGSVGGVGEVEALARCEALFMKGLENRVRYLENEGLAITADITGGRDSRAIFAGLHRLGAKATYYSDDLAGDNEFDFVKGLVKAYGEQVVRVPVKNPEPDTVAMSRMTYLTDCTVNCWTTGFVEYKTLERKRLIGKRSVRFMGFGGEFIRTVFKVPYLYRRMSQLVADDIYFSEFTRTEAARLLGVAEPTLTDRLNRYFDAYPETELADKLKHLYFEYYNTEVNAGENRQRRHFWTVVPLWSLDLLTYQMAAIPTLMSTREFFNRFIRRIDPQAAQAPFYRRGIATETKSDIVKYHVTNFARKAIQGRFALKGARRIKRFMAGEHLPVRSRSRLDEEILLLLDRERSVREYFDPSEVKRVVGRHTSAPKKHYLLTLMMYLAEIDRRIPGRLQAP